MTYRQLKIKQAIEGELNKDRIDIEVIRAYLNLIEVMRRVDDITPPTPIEPTDYDDIPF